MIKVKDIYDYINEIAPFEMAMSYDNVGLLIGEYNTNVKKVLVTLDITNLVADEAKEIGADLIISHHPIIFNPLRRIDKNSVQYKLIQNNIDVIAAHTNYDMAEKGVNYSFAKALKLQNTRVLEKYGAIFGELLFGMTDREFANYTAKCLNAQGVRYIQSDKIIKNVVVCGGAGGDLIFDVVKEGADAFVTGEIKHHEIIFAGENNITVVDAGHYKTEDIFANDLIAMLSSKFPQTEFIKSSSFTDKIIYLS